MKIVGYSERGAMNALFYGMALKDEGDSQMRVFLKLAGIKDSDSFSEFVIYNEFSLSEFGEPDLVIIAKREDKYPVVFFLEAKVSEGTIFCLNNKMENHINDLLKYQKTKCHKNGDASNLFFQLRLKHYFFQQRKTIIEPIGSLNGKSIGENECIEKTKDRNGEIRLRKLGENPIVIKFAKQIENCVDAYYIAIIPEKEKDPNYPNDFPLTLKINYVSWENIYKSELGDLLKDTFDFNKVGNISQILNKQKKK